MRPAGACELTHHEGARDDGRSPLSTVDAALDTLTSQRLCFRALPCGRGLLRRRVALSPLGAALVPRIGAPMARRLLDSATPVAAIALASVVRATHAERRQTASAPEDEDLELAHPARDGRKLDSTCRTADSTCVLLPIHQLYTRGSGCYLVPSPFVAPQLRITQERLGWRDFLTSYDGSLGGRRAWWRRSCAQLRSGLLSSQV